MSYNFVFFTDVTSTTVIYKAIGAYKCAHVLRSMGYTCLVVDYLHTFSMQDFDQLITSAIGENTYAVGFSTTFMMSIDGAVKTDKGLYYSELPDGALFPQGPEFEKTAISKIKSLNADCKIILGGYKVHPNTSNKLVDYAFIGFSEASIVNFANHITQKIPLTDSYKNIWGITVVDNKEAVGYDFRLSTMQWEDTDVVNAKVLPIEIARGCIFKCKFCSYQMNGKQNLDFIRDAELIRIELQNNYDRFGIKNYYIIDDTFNDSDYKLDAMLSAVKKLSFQPYFWAYTRLDLVARNLDSFKKLYDIGLRGYYFGIETMHEKTGRIIGKGYSRQKQIEAIQHIRTHYSDVLLHGSFIIGLPDEPESSWNDTFNNIMSQQIPLHSFGFSGLKLYKNDRVPWNYELSRDYEKFGYQQIPETSKHNRIDFNWANNIVTRDRAEEIATEFTNAGRQSKFYQAPGQLAWALLNYFHDYDAVSQINYRTIDWPNMELRKELFTTVYKKKLLNLVLKNTI